MIGLVENGGGAPGAPLYQLKITLKRFKPPIWRRVVVPGAMRLDRLHAVIQIAMGWTNSHLHQFIGGSGFARTYYSTPDPESAGMGSAKLNEKRYSVADLAPAAKRKFIYEYDFGDGWEHEILVEKILPADPGFKHPVCLAGRNACPPEDCGGVYGYADLLDALEDSRHERHEEIQEWIGDNWDASAFNLEETNNMLKRLKA